MLSTLPGLRPEMAIVRHPDLRLAPTKQVRVGRSKWQKIGIAAAIGITCGIAASALSPSSWSPVPKASQLIVSRSPYVIPSNASVPSGSNPAAAVQSAAVSASNPGSGAVGTADPEEMERLKTRNRRLEALISVLRDRKQHNAN